jgi:large subunit ribosomal protein L4
MEKKVIKKTIKKEVKAVKKPVSKIAVKKAPVTKKAEVNVSKPAVATPVVKKSNSTVKVSVVNVAGTSQGTMTLSSEVFGATPNQNLIAQAVRVYLANQRQGTSSTKTRAEVTGSTRKIYRQKGTGRARHGAAKGPIFVGGGIVFGPHPQDYSMKFPKKMKKAALINALSQKALDGVIKVVDGDFSGKTKEVAKLLKNMELNKKGIADKVLFVSDKNENTARAAHNLAGLKLETAGTLSTYGVVVSKNIIFMKSAITDVTERLTKKD